MKRIVFSPSIYQVYIKKVKILGKPYGIKLKVVACDKSAHARSGRCVL
jgi:hypothetical protein